MSGAGYRTFASGEVLTANNVQTYLMDQAVQVYAGTAARSSAVPSPSTGMVAYATATGLQVFNGSAWVNVGGATYAAISGGASTALGTAIGGTAYNVHTFTADANLVVTTAGLIDYLIFGGGAGGGHSGTSSGGGGGGASGFQTGTVYLAAGTYAVDIGAGGASNTNGSGSSIGSSNGSLSSCGGGAGAGRVDTANRPGLAQSGSCGGGGYYGVQGTTAGALAYINGVTGFNGGTAPFSNGAGAGGGAAAVGANGVGTTGGAGGAGYDVSAFIGGSALIKGGGGGGGGSSGGAGGSSVGGAGASGNANGGTAAANTASGGGGSGTTIGNTGGAGGSGIIYVRVKP